MIFHTTLPPVNSLCRHAAISITLALAVLTIHTPSLLAAPPSGEQREYFESKVRPILAEHCYPCHSVDADEIEADLVLDSKWGWQTGGDSGPAIVPGNLEESLLIDAVRYEENIVSAMPPRSKLPEQQITILEQWVKSGAHDPRPKATRGQHKSVEAFDLAQRSSQHWSWRPIDLQRPPKVKDTAWPVSDLDRFILAKIEAAGLRPAKPADRRTWLRRVYFDLIGLPPTRDQMTQFVADQSADAHQRVVTTLLQSPHFGEKWARHWMDLVRYAETYGHEFDYPIPHAHQYRDYLIRAFNSDVPYDQLVREHIAGDLIHNPRRDPRDGWNESIVGTGFWYLHEATHAPTDVLGNEADIIGNQLDVFGKAFLGLTLACARCHDHKFDAISTADYYGLSAYIQGSCRQEVPLDPGQRIEHATSQINRVRRSAALQLQKLDPGVETRLKPGEYFEVASALLARVRESEDVEQLPQQWIADAASKHQLQRQQLERWVDAADVLTTQAAPDDPSDAVVFADFDGGQLPDGWSTSGFAFQPIGSEVTLSVSGQLASSGTVDSGVAGKKQEGILRSPTFEISTQQIHVRMKATANITMRVVIDNYQMANYSALLFKGTFHRDKATDTDGKWVWKSFAGDLKKYIGHKAYLEFIDHGDATIAIDEIRFSDRLRSRETTDRDLDPATIHQRWLEGLDELRAGHASPFIARMLDAGVLGLADLSSDADRSISRAAQLADDLPSPRYVLAMAQGTLEDAHIYIRGSHLNLGQKVPARFLEALGGKPATRLELAQLVASPDNPLTARVMVNRLWYQLLGRGIVPTVDDFGPQGQPPSHPELLDWLARDFIAKGWSMKYVIGKIVLSQTYRQASVAHGELDPGKIAISDPTDALLHRMRVRRLPSESIRDAILFVSGRLDATPSGSSVPTHRTPFMSGRGARPSGPLDGDGRRSIYLSVYRNFLNPFMLAFDMPTPFGPNGRRSQSNVPAQALTLMNDPLVIQQSGIWADRILAQDGLTDQQRVAEMVEQAHGIVPTADQTAIFVEFLSQQAEIYGVMDRRAWSDLGHVLLNMKAFYFVK